MIWRLFVATTTPEKNKNFDFEQIFKRATNIFGSSYKGFCHVSINSDKILVIVWATQCPFLIKFDIDTQTLSSDTNIRNSIDFFLNTRRRDEILSEFGLEIPPSPELPENNFLLQDTKYNAKIRQYPPLLKEIQDPEFLNRIRICFEKINVNVVDIFITNTYINIILSHKYIETFYMYMLIDGTIEIRKNTSSNFTKTPCLIFNYLEENKYDNLHVDVDIALNPSPFALNPSPFALNPSPFALNPSPFALNSSPFALNPSPFALNAQPAYEKFSQNLIPTIRIKRARMSPDTVEPTNIPIPGTRAVKVQKFVLNPCDACTQTDIIGDKHLIRPVRLSSEGLLDLRESLLNLSSFINSL